MIKNIKNKEYFEEASKIMPGPHSSLRATTRITPIFISTGKGSHVWDVDGNEYIDYIIGWGPGVLGQSNKEFVKALHTQLDTFLVNASGDTRSVLEIAAAKKFIQHVPCAEKVRFLLSDSEAVQLAIRLARAYTKRRYFIRFEGHYHGWLDNVLGGVSREILNIIDEVLTGFRVGLNSAQGLFGVKPDISTFEKAIGAGVPVAALCGKRKLWTLCCKGELQRQVL
jgi:glutamate-1-semialdehyde 2,1-aminomutase